MLSLQKYRHFIFDFDGVICDSLGLAIEAFNRIRDEHFPMLPQVACQEDMTIVYAGSLRTCLSRWLSEADGKRFFDLHSAAMAERAKELKTFPGVAKALSSLPTRGVSIVTSAYSHAVREILSKDRDFDEKCLNQIAGRELRQPKTDKINTILSGLALSPDQAVYVGDLESDILYCRNVPIDIIAVSYGYHPHKYLSDKNPTYCVSSVNELHALLVEMADTNNLGEQEI